MARVRDRRRSVGSYGMPFVAGRAEMTAMQLRRGVTPVVVPPMVVLRLTVVVMTLMLMLMLMMRPVSQVALPVLPAMLPAMLPARERFALVRHAAGGRSTVR